MLAILFALFAGFATIASPCTLPVLPILLGASVGQTGGLRPMFITLGFICSFAAAVLVFSAVTQIFGVDQNTLRGLAAALLLVFGFFLLWPRAWSWLASRAPGFHTTGRSMARADRHPNLEGLVIGASLGLVWTPCGGPILASILTLIATAPAPGRGALLLVVYALGAAAPMLAIAYGGQFVTTRVKSVARISPRLQQGFGVVTMCFAVAMFFQYDALLSAWLSDLYPGGDLDL
jgi:cytochrome c-type biogenesis protein